ncbi:MAG: hypothetical protein ACPL3P_07740 [Anaerolineales bacterium]
MQVYGKSNVAEFLADFIVFRNLTPLDPRLPNLKEIRPSINLAENEIPRKHELAYAQVIVTLLKAAQKLQNPKTELKRLIFVGDTRMSDGNAFDNICKAAGWQGIIFIGSENSEELKFESIPTAGGQVMVLSNRWATLNAESEINFRDFCAAHKFAIDESTAVIVDLDKTALAARGRNAHVIDQARIQAVRDTVESLLGDSFNAERFLSSYNQLNQPEFHPFTADNQDYLAYICLILGSGLYDPDKVIQEIRGKRLLTFRQFIDQVETHKYQLATPLQNIHNEIYQHVRAADPTPFKTFRRNEYRNTIQRMGFLPDNASVENLLREEIVITQEVRQLALDWKQEGALVFGLSDKPDEASVPSPELAAQGFQAIHRAMTHIVGA